MKFSFIAGMLLVLWSRASLSSDAHYTFPVSKAKRADGYALYVDDAAIKSTVPGFADVGPRRSTCANSMIVPPALWITFEPRMTGPHKAVLSGLECSFADRDAIRELTGDLTCEAHVDDTIGFDRDPNTFFSMIGTGDRAMALELFRAFFGDRVQFADGSKKPELDKIRDVHMLEEAQGVLKIMWGDCGCTFSVRARRETNGSWKADNLGGICV
jgi:hypothetical protein